MRKKRLNVFLVLFFLGFFIMPKAASAEIYWISPSPNAAWPNCKGVTDPGNYCSLSSANSGAQPGDTVYFKAGTYSSKKLYGLIEPSNSGSDGNWITFSAAPKESVTLTHSDASAVFLEGKHHIRILGFNITANSNTGSGSVLAIRGTWGCSGTHHIEFANNTAVASGGYLITIADFCSSSGARGAAFSHIWIHDNVIRHSSYTASGCIEMPKEIINVGGAYNTSIPLNQYVTIENNILSHSGHSIIDWYWTINSVVKNNKIHNEPWIQGVDYQSCNQQPVYLNEGGFDYTVYNGYYSHRCVQISDGYDSIADSNILIEGNRFGHSGPNQNNRGSNGLELSAAGCIIRYNDFYNNKAAGLSTKFDNVDNNMIYSNTFFHNGWGFTGWAGGSVYMSNRAVNLVGGSYNWFKNNLMYDSRSVKDIAFLWGEPGGDPAGGGVFANNWCNVPSVCSASGNPQFVDPDVSSPLNFNKPDLRLQTASPARDGGAHLTFAMGSGSSSNILIVNDALYFQDGTLGADMARGVTLFPDWIAIGTVTNAVKISSINYDTNTITLASPMTWSSGAPIWLYRKSDGERVLYGSAPDYGAYEYGSSTPPPACPGTCCSSEQTCQGGSVQPGYDCGSLCCIGGICTASTQTCSDGTSYGSCSATKPLYCSSGTLINNCQTCGCPIDQTCQSSGTCQASSGSFLPEQAVQAESGILNGMQTGVSGADTYIYTSMSNAGNASYTFQIQSPGKYLIQSKVNTNNDTGRNSFYVGLDSEDGLNNNSLAYDIDVRGGFFVDNVCLRGPLGNSTWSQYDPMLWDLTAGLHTFTFYGREPNTWLDQIILKACHKSDSDCSGCVSNTELTAFINLWYLDSSNPTLKELMEAIGFWKRGCWE